MQSFDSLLGALQGGGYDGALSALYAPETPGTVPAAVRARAERLAAELETRYAPARSARSGFFSSPGRTELGGNHTDHQHGRVLCGSVDLDMLCCAAENGKNVIRVCSEGYAPVEIPLGDTAPRASEYGQTAALVRGMAALVADLGYPVAGFDACLHSGVPAGSGLSSSAAFEILMGVILNRLFCGGALDATAIAKLGQRTENEYFGKPCGLMDQMGAACGGAIAIDFETPAEPKLTRPGYDFSRSGHRLCIVDTGGSHADLTADYAAIPEEMGAVAACFGASVLREVDEAAFRAALPAVREKCGDRAVLRALHFFGEERTVLAETEALQKGDFPAFLRWMRVSGASSAQLLENTWSPARPRAQALPLALAVGAEVLGEGGAIRVHGGGFAGTIQAFVPEALLARFRGAMEALFGQGKCHVLRIRPEGGCMLEP